MMFDQFNEDYQKIIENVILASTISNRPHKDTIDTLYEFGIMINTYKLQESSISKENTLLFPPHSSLKSFNELKPIKLKHMKVNYIHEGKYLICKTIVKPFFMFSMCLIVEDEDSEVENLEVYNYSTSYEIDPNILIPDGSVIIIKEPFIVSSLTDKKKSYIRVESPSDIIIVTGTHSISKWLPKEARWDTEKLKKEGNQCFVAKKYQKAIDFYQLALKKDGSNKEDLYSNLAAAYLKLEKYYSAYESALNSPTEKGYFRLGIACYSMRQFLRAKDAFEKVLKLNPSNKSIKNELDRVKERIKENQTGEYDFEKIIKDHENGVLRHDIADYHSEDIKFETIKGRRAVLATSDIKNGTLIVASKAFSISFKGEFKESISTMHCITKKMDRDEAIMNKFELFNKVQNDPFNAREVYKLYSGKKVSKKNQFKCGIVDANHLENILALNASSSYPYDLITKGKVDKTYQYENKNSGLWILSSNFRHSCVSNTHTFYFGDVQLIFARKDIKKDEEITIRYIESEQDLDDRTELLEQWNIECDCRLCYLDRNYPDYHAKRITYSNLHSAIIDSEEDRNATKKILALAKEIEELYRDRKELEDYLMLLYSNIGRHFHFIQDYEKCGEYFVKTYKIAREFDTWLAMYSLTQAILSFSQVQNIIEATKYFKEMFREFPLNKHILSYQLRSHDIDLEAYKDLFKLLEILI